MTEPGPTVFVVDDDPSVREALTSLLRSARLRVVAFASGKEFLRQRRPEFPACLVLEVRLPEMDGFEIQHELLQGGYQLPVIFITGHGSIPACVRAMRAGAMDFLTKPFCDEELLAAIRYALEVHKGTRTKDRYTAHIREWFATLTRREREVMEHVVQGLLNKQIAAALGTAEITIKVHRGRVMQKMHAASLPELVRMSENLAWPGEDERTVQRWLRDTRERERSALALRQSAARSALVLDAITDMFFAFDQDFRFTYMNQDARKRIRLLGKDPDQLIGRLVWDDFADWPNADALRRVMNERVPLTDEVYYAPLGQWFEEHLYPSNGGGLVVFSCDVTERKRNEACLEAGQRISHTGSWVWNAASKSVFWSAEYFRIMGLDPQVVKPTYELFFERLHPDDRDAVRQAFEAAAEERRNYAGEYRFVRTDGSIRHVRGEAQPVTDARGNLLQYIGTAVDLTERKRSEAKAA